MKMERFWVVAVAVAVFNLCLTTFISSLSGEEYEGTLEVLMATEVKSGKCEPLYFIKSKEKRTQFSPPADVPSLTPGQKIKISGQWEETDGKKSFRCETLSAAPAAPAKKDMRSATDISAFLPEQSPVLGPQRTLAVLVSFPDHSLPGWGKAEMENKVFFNEHSDNSYWKECSGEKMWLEGGCDDGWKNMLKPSSEYGYGSDDEINRISALMYDAISAMDQYIDFRQWDRVIFMRTGKGWGYAFGTLGQWPFSTNEGQINLALAVVSEVCLELKSHIIAHEFGHGLSLLHADSRVISTGKIYGYGDANSAMGHRFAQIDSLAKYRLGWLDLNQIKLLDLNQDDDETWLDQRELASDGLKLLVIFLGYDKDENPILYCLEYFKNLGEFDSQVFSSFEFEFEAKKDAVLLRKYEKDLNPQAGRFSDSLIYTNGESWPNDDVPVLGKMQEYCDSEHANAQAQYERYGVCFKVLEKTGWEENSQAKVGIRFIHNPKPVVDEIQLISVKIKKDRLFLLKGETTEVAAKVLDEGGKPVPNVPIIGTLSSNKKVSFSPSSALSNEEGLANFTVTANNLKKGGATITFTAQEIKKNLRVKVK